MPDRTERPERLASVLQVIYLLFTEGYAPAGGTVPLRPEVAREAVRLARQLAALTPNEPEVLALIALMEFQSSRFAARVDAEGLPLTLSEQDRRRWDRSAIARGQAALARASASERGFGYYGLQAAIAQCHAVGRDLGRHRLATDRAPVRRPRAAGPVTRDPAQSCRRGRRWPTASDVALALVDALAADLATSARFHAVRAELLERSGQADAAARAFDRAAALPGNDAETTALRRRAEAARATSERARP